MDLEHSDVDVDQKRGSMEKDMETSKRKTVSNCLPVEELEKANLEIMKFSQPKRIPEDFLRLHKGKSVKEDYHIYLVCPLMDMESEEQLPGSPNSQELLDPGGHRGIILGQCHGLLDTG